MSARALGDLTTDADLGQEFFTVGKVVASAVHEIRNPLAAAWGFTQLIEEQAEPPLKDYAAIVLKELARIRQFLKEISLLVPTVPPPPRQRVKLRELVEEAVAYVSRRAPQRVCIQIDVSPEVTVCANRKRLAEALRAVLLNAAEAVDERRQIRVFLARSKNQLRLVIYNTGEPIAPRVLGRVFDPFFSTKPDRLGLGLSKALRIMLDHRGYVEIENRANGVQVSLVFCLECQGPGGAAAGAKEKVEPALPARERGASGASGCWQQAHLLLDRV